MRRSRLSPVRATAAAAASVVLALGLTGCGFDLQSLQPDTHGQGVNTEAGGVKIRDLLIVETSSETGRLAGTLISSSAADQLVSVSGHVITLEGNQGAALTASGSAVQVPAGGLVVLTDGPGVMVTSSDLRAGLTATITLRFQSGAETTVTTVIVDTQSPVYRTVTPAPTGGPQTP